MTESQTEIVIEALVGINENLKKMNMALVDIYARLGTLDDDLDVWMPMAMEYGESDD